MEELKIVKQKKDSVGMNDWMNQAEQHNIRIFPSNLFSKIQNQPHHD